jgi:hypothetical protein
MRKKIFPAYGSEWLKEKIFNPEIPAEWDNLTYDQGVYVYNGLFLCLHPEFQKKYGKHLELLLSIKTLRDNIPVIEQTDIAEPWNFRVDIADICTFLLRHEFPFLTPLRGFNEPDWDFLNKAVYEARDISAFQKFRTAMSYGEIPDRIYAGVDIFKSKDTLLHDFEAFIDTLQKVYFEQNPEKRSVLYGHVRKRSNNTPQKVDKDVMKKRFQAYILSFLGKKDSEIADIFFPGNAAATKRVEKILNAARKYIKGAWTNDFPPKLKLK